MLRLFLQPIALLLLSGVVSLAAAQLVIRIDSVPRDTPDTAAIYVAGSFNNWDPGAPVYRLQKRGTAYTITLPAEVRGPIEFKFTRGSWERVETDVSGGDVANRSFSVSPSSLLYQSSIAAWRSGVPAARARTATSSVSVLDSAFAIPQLGRTGRVWLYLPPDYATSNKRYPVLYMHDGQNVFDAATSYAGEWGVDETLDSLHAAGDHGVIVVAIDHGGTQRINEYSPWPTRFGSGAGDKYVAFLVNTLKPWIDAHYRTRPERAHTGIAGSSMGGLISFYAVLKHPDVFGRAMVFSPAFWIAPAAYELAARARPVDPDTRLYMISGELEVAAGEQAGVYQRDQERMVEALTAAGFRPGTQLRANIVADGAHSEWFWRREFAAAYHYLFESK